LPRFLNLTRQKCGRSSGRKFTRVTFGKKLHLPNTDQRVLPPEAFVRQIFPLAKFCVRQKKYGSSLADEKKSGSSGPLRIVANFQQ